MRKSLLLLALFILLLPAAPVFSQEQVRTIESFDFLIDASSSMQGENLNKVLKQINAEIPDIAYPEAGIHTFAPEDDVLEFREYDKARFSQGIDKLNDKFPGGKNSSLGNGLDFYGPGFSNMLRPGSVIVFTDGNYGSGRDTLNEAKIFYLTQPGMCLHFVSFASNDESQKLIDQMAALAPQCSVSVRAADLVDNPEATRDFVRDVFYDSVQPSAAPAVIDFVMFSIPFGFDSTRLDANTAKVADAVAERLRSAPDLELKIDGYTCSTGPAEYNLGLSRRRAEAVKQYIVNTGVEPSRIVTEGFGENNPRYDNNTREGRSLNRRVEFTFFSDGAEV